MSSRELVPFGDVRVPERIWTKISPCPMSGCWLWNATFSGSPQIRWKVDGRWKVVNVRRVFGALVDIDAPLIASDCSACVNPAHYHGFDTIEAVTTWAAARDRLTYCKNGHSMADAYDFGYRRCRTCQALAMYRFAKKKFDRRVARMTAANKRRAITERRRRRQLWADGKIRRRDGTFTPVVVLP